MESSKAYISTNTYDLALTGSASNNYKATGSENHSLQGDAMKIAFYALNQSFCKPIIDELSQYHTVKVWRPSGDQNLDNLKVLRLFDWSDLAYCEFIHYPLSLLTNLDQVDKPIVTYMDGIDVMDHASVDWRKVSLLMVQTMMEARLIRLRKWWHQDNPGKKLVPLPTHIVAINRPIDLDLFHPDLDRNFGICFHATVIRETKRVYTALQCFNELIHKDPGKPWKFYLIGQWEGGYKANERGEYLMVCNELIEQMDLPPERLAIISKNYPRNEWAEFIRKMGVYWILSFREGFPNSMAEACAAGVYPIMNRFAGAELIYPEKYICDWPSQIVEKTIAWGNLSSEEKIKEANLARKHVEQWESKKIIQQVRLLVEETADNYAQTRIR